MSAYRIDGIGMLEMDIEEGEFTVLAVEEDLSWRIRWIRWSWRFTGNSVIQNLS